MIRDNKVPNALTIIIADGSGNVWGTVYATAKEFSTGSVGFYASGKVVNPSNPECKYQVGTNVILVGSKPTK